MKYCKLCGVFVDTEKEYCPLCYGSLEEKSKKLTPEVFAEKKVDKTKKRRKNLIARIFLTISVVIISTCAFINLYTKSSAWSVIVALSVVYLWILVAHTILSHASPFKKTFLQIVGIIALLLATNQIFSSTDWLINYVFPSFSLLVMIVLAFMIFCSKNRKEYVFEFFSVDIILMLVSLIFLIFNLGTYRLLNQLNVIAQAIICFAYMLFAGRNILTNLCRRFHI